MKFVFILLLTTILCSEILAQENPFMQMVGKKYVEYSQKLTDEYDNFFTLDTIETQNIIRQIEEVAKKTNNVEWKLQVDYFNLLFFDLKRILYGDNLYSAEELLKKALKLLEKTKKENIVYLELIVRQKIISYYWFYFKNYELAFEQYAIQEKVLENIFSDDIPEKTHYYRRIADAHYAFKNYSKAIFYFNKVLEDKDNIFNELPKQHARNGLGLSYRYGYNDIDYSDSFFYAIIQTNYVCLENKKKQEIWIGIAEGNIGENLLFRQEYDKAIPLLKSSIEKMLKYNDYAYASGTAVSLADIYLKKGNPTEAKRYLDLAREYYNKMPPRDGRLLHIYEVMSKYYIATGNVKLGVAYMDSTLIENKRNENQFNALQLMRVEQRNHLLEQKVKEEQLKTEKIRSAGYKRNLIIALVGLLFIGIIFVRYVILYYKKKDAYRELVFKSQQWAAVEIKNSEQEPILKNELEDEVEHTEKETHNNLPDEIDFLIINDIEKLMLEEKLYRNTALSIDLLSKILNMKRYHVSASINHCMKKSFNTFINEYRIKEAIQSMSENNTTDISIDQIAFNVGFNDRKNFYRVFKKMTGLSPTEFRKNINLSCK
jgi:AraC-like DNA-binding protein